MGDASPRRNQKVLSFFSCRFEASLWFLSCCDGQKEGFYSFSPAENLISPELDVVVSDVSVNSRPHVPVISTPRGHSQILAG